MKIRSVLAVAAGVAIAAGAMAPDSSSARARSAAAVTGGLTPDSISGLAGHTSKVSLEVNLGATGRKLGSYQVALVWDSTVVRLDSIRAGNFGSLDGGINFVSGGEVRLAQVNANGVAGVATLAHLYFRFVSDSIGDRTEIVPTFIELTAAGDFTNLLADFATVSGVARVAPAPVKIGFTPDSVYERVGFAPVMALTADLTQAPDVALGSYVASISWDPTVMQLDSAVVGAFGGTFEQNPSAGALLLTGANAAGAGGSVSLATLYFRFLGTSFPRQTGVGISVSELHAATSFADLLPGLATNDGAAVIGGVLRGDIDKSGVVAALDAQQILQSVVGLTLPAGSQALPHGDGDCNGTLTARDAQIVLNQVVSNDVAQFCVGRIR